MEAENFLEEELSAKLEGAWIIRRRHLSEVAICKSGVDAVPLRMVEGVVGFSAKLDHWPFTLSQVEVLEEAEVPIEEPRTDDRILVGAPESLIRSSRPWSSGGFESRLIEPCQLLLRVAPRTRQEIGTVCCVAAQPEGVWRIRYVDRVATLGCGNAGELPSTEQCAGECALGVQEEGHIVNVVCAEYIPAIDRAGATVVFDVERIGDLPTGTLLSRGGKIAALDINFVGPGVGQLYSQSMLVLHTDPGLEGVVVAVSYVFGLGDAAKPQVLSVEVCVPA